MYNLFYIFVHIYRILQILTYFEYIYKLLYPYLVKKENTYLKNKTKTHNKKKCQRSRLYTYKLAKISLHIFVQINIKCFILYINQAPYYYSRLKR